MQFHITEMFFLYQASSISQLKIKEAIHLLLESAGSKSQLIHIMDNNIKQSND